LAITYDADWSGIECDEEGEISVAWWWSKFTEKAAAENLTVPPAFLRPDVHWEATLRKENNSLRVILKEPIWTPDKPSGPPPMVLFGPNAIAKIRTSVIPALPEMTAVLGILYQGRYSIQEEVASHEWAMVGSFGDGVIPIQYRLEPPQLSSSEVVAIHGSILDSGLRTQNYDDGLDKCVRKFGPTEESSAAVSVHTGWQGDHGLAVVFEQGPRRCLLFDTVDGLTSEEALWTALASWATFQPWLSMPRKFPGKLYYPDDATHIFTECWNHLDDLSSSPGFSGKSQICQAAMLVFSAGLSKLVHESWAPQPTAEAPEKLAKIAYDAACSRLRPVADGPNQWDMHRSSVVTDGPGSLSSSVAGPESGPGSGLTGTCVASRNPSYA
jgi:hypothetical protein